MKNTELTLEDIFLKITMGEKVVLSNEKASEKAVEELDKMSEENSNVSDKEDNSSEKKESEE